MTNATYTRRENGGMDPQILDARAELNKDFWLGIMLSSFWKCKRWSVTLYLDVDLGWLVEEKYKGTQSNF